MNAETTLERLIERYHSYNRRPSIEEPRTRKVIFNCFARVLGPWLPEDRSAEILDAGCGEGALLAFLRESGYGRLAGFDLSPENVSICHGLGLGFVKRFDALELARFEPGSSYDVILATDLLEHLPKQAAAGFLEQARLRLRPQGALIVQTPNMGSVIGHYHRFNDLSHEFALTEKSARDLFLTAGFDGAGIEIRAAWSATTALGRLREAYLRALHFLIFAADGAGRPRIATRNLLIRARRG